MDFGAVLAAFEAAAYTAGAIFGFYLLLTRAKIPRKSLPGVEEASWLFALFLFSQALWSYSKLALMFLGSPIATPGISDLFFLVGQGGLTLFLLRLTSADPVHNRLGALLVLFMVAGLNALLIKYVLLSQVGGEGAELFRLATAGFMVAQAVLAASQIVKNRDLQARSIWIALIFGTILQALSMLVFGGEVLSSLSALAATLLFGIFIPWELIWFEQGRWPRIGKFAKQEELHIASAAFTLMIYLMLFTTYFFVQSNNGSEETKVHDNLFFFISSCWIYLLFASLTWYAHYRHRSEENAEDMKGIRDSLNRQVADRTRQLARRVAELEKFEDVAAGREERIAELKREITDMKRKSAGGLAR